jgi:hypothetical protein
MPLQLIVIDGPSLGQQFQIDGAGAFLVGRSVGANFSLRSGPKPDTRISKRHALVEFNSPRCWVHRISSKNVLSLNGNVVEAANLRDGDRVTVGKTTFQVRLTPPASPPTLSLAETTAILRPAEPLPDSSGDLPALGLGCPFCGEPMSPSSILCPACDKAAKQLRQPLGQFRLVKSMGKDRIGQSFVGLHVDTRKIVSVRLIHPASILPTAVSVAFLRDLRQLREIRHQHLGRIEQVGLQNGMFFIASKWIRGKNLIRYIKKNRTLRVGDALGIGVQILSALKTLHRAGRVHGYLHPRNIYLRMTDKSSGVKLADAGIELSHRRLQIGGCLLPSEEPGNPSFLAPEILIDSRKASPASDQYSTAAVLYYLLTGHRPYRLAKHPRDRIVQKLRDEPIPLRQHRPDLPAKVIATIHCALSRDPKRRFADVSHFRSALKDFLKK